MDDKSDRAKDTEKSGDCAGAGTAKEGYGEGQQNQPKEPPESDY